MYPREFVCSLLIIFVFLLGGYPVGLNGIQQDDRHRGRFHVGMFRSPDLQPAVPETGRASPSTGYPVLPEKSVRARQGK